MHAATAPLASSLQAERILRSTDTGHITLHARSQRPQTVALSKGVRQSGRSAHGGKKGIGAGVEQLTDAKFAFDRFAAGRTALTVLEATQALTELNHPAPRPTVLRYLKSRHPDSGKSYIMMYVCTNENERMNACMRVYVHVCMHNLYFVVSLSQAGR